MILLINSGKVGLVGLSNGQIADQSAIEINLQLIAVIDSGAGLGLSG